MPNIRAGRVGEQIKKELSLLLQTELKDPRIGFVTLTAVEMTNDLSIATVYLTVMGDEEEKARTLRALDSAAGFLRSEIGRRISLRKAPELHFKIDPSIERGTRIDQLLKEIQEKDV